MTIFNKLSSPSGIFSVASTLSSTGANSASALSALWRASKTAGGSLFSVRGVRHRQVYRAYRRTDDEKPADFIDDATTYADRHSVVLDQHSPLPYKPAELENEFLSKEYLTRKAHAQLKAKEKYKRKYLLNLNFDHIPIDEQVILMFPGQGTQHIGMGRKVIDHAESARLFERANEILGYDLLDVCQHGPQTKLDQTIYCQAAVFVSSMAALEKLKSEQTDLMDRVTNAAGFSVGEYCALVAGDVLSFEDALKIIKVRAEAMHECSMVVPSGMMTVRVSAVSQLDEAMQEARQAAREEAEEGICDVANYLFCGVKVVGGSNLCLKFLEENSNRFRFQVIKRLPVSGAFHTKLMEPAEEKVARLFDEITVRPPRINVYSNVTGKVYFRRPGDIRRCIIKQISEPVKWEQIVQLLFRKHKDYNFPSYVEVGPGRQLGAILHKVSKKAYESYLNYPC